MNFKKVLAMTLTLAMTAGLPMGTMVSAEESTAEEGVMLTEGSGETQETTDFSVEENEEAANEEIFEEVTEIDTEEAEADTETTEATDTAVSTAEQETIAFSDGTETEGQVDGEELSLAAEDEEDGYVLKSIKLEAATRYMLSAEAQNFDINNVAVRAVYETPEGEEYKTTLGLDSADCGDSHGVVLEYGLYNAAGEKVSMENITAGIYTLKASCGNISDELTITYETIQDAAKRNSALTKDQVLEFTNLGDDLYTIGTYWTKSVGFTPDQSGTYTFKGMNVFSSVLYDAEGNRLNGSSEGIADSDAVVSLTSELTGGSTYYLVCEGTLNEAGTASLSVTQSCNAASLAFSGIGGTTNPFEIGDYLKDYISNHLVVTYKDGHRERLVRVSYWRYGDIGTFTGFTIESGDKIKVELRKGGNTYMVRNAYDNATEIGEGTYTLHASVIFNSAEVASCEQTLNVNGVPQSAKTLDLGKTTPVFIQAQSGNYFTFTAAGNSRYQLTMKGDWTENSEYPYLDIFLYRIGSDGTLTQVKAFNADCDTTEDSALMKVTANERYVLYVQSAGFSDHNLNFTMTDLGCEHSWSDWKTTTAATALAPAKQTRTCSDCGKTETRNYGSKLKATIKTNASSVTLKRKQSTKAVKVYGFAKGDYVKSVTSNKKSVVKVSSYNKNGTMKLTAGSKNGKAVVTVKLASGKTQKINVKVQKGNVTTKKISGIASKMTIRKGKTANLKPTFSPLTSTQKITYRSSNKKVATVSSSGKIKALKKGTATITIKSGNVTKKVKITVR